MSTKKNVKLPTLVQTIEKVDLWLLFSDVDACSSTSNPNDEEININTENKVQ